MRPARALAVVAAVAMVAGAAAAAAPGGARASSGRGGGDDGGGGARNPDRVRVEFYGEGEAAGARWCISHSPRPPAPLLAATAANAHRPPRPPCHRRGPHRPLPQACAPTGERRLGARRAWARQSREPRAASGCMPCPSTLHPSTPPSPHTQRPPPAPQHQVHARAAGAAVQKRPRPDHRAGVHRRRQRAAGAGRRHHVPARPQGARAAGGAPGRGVQWRPRPPPPKPHPFSLCLRP
jgi:hypothetical protein